MDKKALYPFEVTKQETLFHKLIHELRCSVCPNQNIAESEAGLAIDLKNEIYQQVLSNRNEEEVIQCMMERYGEVVLYRPPFHPGTYALWLGPVILVCFGIFAFLRTVKFKEG